MRPTLIISIVLMFMTVNVHSGQALDADTQQLEQQALCQAMPYRCPGYDPRSAQERETHQLCDGLTRQMTLIESKRLLHTSLDASEQEAERVWQTSCRAWDLQQRQTRADEARLRARLTAPPSYSSTLDCVTTTEEGRYSSRLTTTCTLH
jgi:hypothetical protein